MKYCCLLLGAAVNVALLGCAPKWNAAIRFEGGTSTPQVPLVIRIRSAGDTGRYDGILEHRCIQVLVQDPAGKDLKIEVTDRDGRRIGVASVRIGDKQEHYIPVDGQLGVLTINPGKSCK